jgi:hypothetical protein
MGKKMKIKEQAKAWTVRYTRPKTITYQGGERTFDYNYCSVIVATTVAWAVETVMTEYPDATLISVHPGSTGPIIVDSRSIAE